MEHWSDFFPLVFLPFKLIVIGIGGYFAIKWHQDEGVRQGKKELARRRSAQALAERQKAAEASVADAVPTD